MAKDEITKVTPTHLITKLTYLYSNLQELLNKLVVSMSSYSETVTTTLQATDGTPEIYNIPSLGYLFNEVEILTKQMESLINLNNDTLSLKYTDGSIKNFEMKKLSALIDELEEFAEVDLPLPEEFRIKNNWFFESFLNPMLYVNVNLSDIIGNLDIDSFAVKRVIIEKDNQEAGTYFDESIKGRADINITEILNELDNQGIPYYMDDTMVDRSTSINRYNGSYAVTQLLSDTAVVDSVSIERKLYKLDTLKYYDLINTEKSTKFLAKGDILITNNDSEYEIVDINYDNKIVYLERSFGTDSIGVGANVLKIKPLLYRSPNIQIGIGYNERNIIFIKPISKLRNMSGHNWNSGVAIYTNELQIKLSNGELINLSQYYDTYVSDFSLMFSNFTKESKLPASVAIQPDSPVLNLNNFNVELVNAHIKNSISEEGIENDLATKEKLESDIAEYNKTISDLTSRVNSTETLNKSEIQNLDKDIKKSTERKTNATKQLTSLISQLNYNIKSKPNMISNPKYRLRGFWEIPDPKQSMYGVQHVVKFLVSYRYLSKDGAPNDTKQMSYVDKTGKSNVAFFSNWIEVDTKARIRIKNEDTDIFEWQDEDTKNAEEVNINQLDIPINKGESVEIRIKSISEAGYPDNPVFSDFSDSVVITFPEIFEMKDNGEVLVQKLLIDESVLNFSEELNAKHLDLHLMSGFIRGDRYYTHKLSDIFSGSYDTNGDILDAEQKIRKLEDRIVALENALTGARGVIKVSIVDNNGNIINVNKGDTISLFAGYYRDIIEDNTGLNEGDILTSSYVISIENTSQTQLELVSRLAGGIDEVVEPSPNADDYGINRKYDRTPLLVSSNTIPMLGELKQPSPWQSGNVKSQFIYSRYKDNGLINNLYENDNKLNDLAAYDSNDVMTTVSNYDFLGNTPNGTGVKVPFNGYNYLPYDPTYSDFGLWNTNTDVWAGTLSSSPAAPDGGGYLSDFCIHKDHPEVTALTGTPSDITLFYRPTMLTNQAYYPFAHGLHFETSVQDDTNIFGTKYYKQIIYRTPDEPSVTIRDNHFPVKIGYHVNDKYLIGKYTCGSYLFIAPTKYDDISIDGNHPDIAKKTIEYGSENAINIPLAFQFRCVDTLGYVGGFSMDRTLSNVEYTKKIGFDIYDRANSTTNQYGDIFSFDVEVNCKYKQKTPNITPVSFVTKGAINKINYA